MPKSGKSLEQLIAALENALRCDNTVTVESPKHLVDRITGKKREHDVVLTIKQGHHEVLIAIECRDRSRSITVNQVESFWKKCQDTGVDQGVIVSSSGFYNTARKKAAFLGIRCLDIKDAASFNWMLAQGMHLVAKRLLHQSWTFFPEKEGVADQETMEVLGDEGHPVSQEFLASQAIDQLNKLWIAEPAKEATLVVRFPGGNLKIRNSRTGETTPVRFALAKLDFEAVREFVPFRLVNYKSGEEDLAEAAIAEIAGGSSPGRMLFVGRPGGEKKLIYLPNKKQCD